MTAFPSAIAVSKSTSRRTATTGSSTVSLVSAIRTFRFLFENGASRRLAAFASRTSSTVSAAGSRMEGVEMGLSPAPQSLAVDVSRTGSNLANRQDLQDINQW